jgi:hypothetical protein
VKKRRTELTPFRANKTLRSLNLSIVGLRVTVMPYMHLDLPGTYSTAVKRDLATRLCRLYAELMQTQSWRPNVGIAELGEGNLFHLGPDGLE